MIHKSANFLLKLSTILALSSVHVALPPEEFLHSCKYESCGAYNLTAYKNVCGVIQCYREEGEDGKSGTNECKNICLRNLTKVTLCFSYHII